MTSVATSEAASPRVPALGALRQLAGQRWLLWALLALGLGRALISLLAYPPARGADSLAYFFYAERLYGLDIPGLSQVVPPLYPILILISYKWLGSIYVLIVAQILMSAAIVPLYYDAIRRVDALLALGTSLIVLFDFQTAVAFNFISTEPLYIFLLALSFNLFMRAMERNSCRITHAATGVSLFLLMLTRAVGRYLILPLALLHLLRLRSWKRLLIFTGGFALALALYALLSQALLKQVEGVDSSSYMITGVASKNREWLAAANGPATVEFMALLDYCDNVPGNIYVCYERQHGSREGLIPLLANTVLETVRANIGPYAASVWAQLNDFLKLSGQQYGRDPGLPSAIQCADPNGRVDAMTVETTYEKGWGWAWGARDYIDNHFETFRETLRPIVNALCPPWPDSPTVRRVVDTLSFRYRSLGRPNPMLWYGALWLLVLIVPWMRRRYLMLVLAGSVFLFNHALISAVIDNVQPRYVMVTNPFRALLLLTLLYLLLRLILQGIQRLRHADPPKV